MSLQTHKVKFTYEDYLLFPEDGRRHELIDGERFMTPAPSTRHQKISGKLFLFLANHLLRTNAGEVLYERCGVREYWIVDPELETVDIHRLTDHRYIRAAELSLEADHAIETPLLTGLKLKLSDIFS